MKLSSISERHRGAAVCALIVLWTLAAQLGFETWPFVRYNMFVNTAHHQFSFFQIEGRTKDGPVMRLPLTSIIAPFGPTQIQQVLREKFVHAKDSNAFCAHMSKWISKTESFRGLNHVHLRRQRWKLGPGRLSNLGSEILHSCSINY